MNKTASNAIVNYMGSISGFKQITTKEEKELFNLIQKGDKNALEKLITSNLKLVVKIAHQFKNKGAPLEDLIGLGNMGLIESAKKFNPTKGAKFSTYSAFWIKAYIRRSLGNYNSIIRIPFKTWEKINQIISFKKEFERTNKRTPTIMEIARALKMTPRTVKNTLESLNLHTVSMSASINDEKGEIQDLIKDVKAEESVNQMFSKENSDLLRKHFTDLSHREKEILIKRYGLDGKPPVTLEALGKELCITRERVRQIHNEALKHLRKAFNLA